MKPSQPFRIAIRLIGLLGWLVGFFYLVSASIARLVPKFRAGMRPWWQYAVAALFFFLLEWLLLRRLDRVVAFADPIRSADTAEAP
jgi:hypothetical protein